MALNCPVCLDPFGTNSPDIIATHCGHIIHTVCYEIYFNREHKASCPKCKRLLKGRKTTSVFPQFGNAVDDVPSPRGTGSSASNSVTVAGLKTDFLLTPRRPQKIKCDHDACIDQGLIHECLVDDFNTLLGKFSAHEEAIRKEVDLMDSLQKNNNTLESTSKSQLAKRQSLMKRPNGKEKASAPKAPKRVRSDSETWDVPLPDEEDDEFEDFGEADDDSDDEADDEDEDL